MTAIIDSHCHLADPKLSPEADAVIERARQAGVATIVSVGAIGTIETDRLTVEIAEKHPNVFAAIGVHPHDANSADPARIAAVRGLARSRKVVAIGESGLDFFYMHSPAGAQEASMRRHLELAGEVGLPIVIHCRDAETKLVEIIGESGMPAAGGVIHCFTGDVAAAREFVRLGFHISFSGILTFRTAGALREAAREVPEDRLMVETDAPFLAPEPYRGKRNEPAFVVKTLEKLAELRGVEPARMASLTAANTRRLFRIPEPAAVR